MLLARPLQDASELNGMDQEHSNPLVLLSPREVEIARLTSEGFSNKEIGRILEISPHTVSSHMRRIYSKLGVHRRSRLSYLFAAWTTGGNFAALSG